MRLSRPCYDKGHRCPGWAGGGWKYPKGPSRCYGGHIRVDRDQRFYTFKFWPCDTCEVVTWPSVTRWLDPTWTFWWFRHRMIDAIEYKWFLIKRKLRGGRK